jgi:hypothetical protein
MVVVMVADDAPNRTKQQQPVKGQKHALRRAVHQGCHLLPREDAAAGNARRSFTEFGLLLCQQSVSTAALRHQAQQDVALNRHRGRAAVLWC